MLQCEVWIARTVKQMCRAVRQFAENKGSAGPGRRRLGLWVVTVGAEKAAEIVQHYGCEL